MDSPRNVASNITSLLNALKYSVERTSRLGFGRRRIEALGLDIVDIAIISGKLESMRIPMNALSRSYPRVIRKEDFRKHVEYVVVTLDELLVDDTFRNAAENLSFRLSVRDIPDKALENIIPQLSDENTNVYLAALFVQRYMTQVLSQNFIDSLFEEQDELSFSGGSDLEQSEANISALKKIIPPQKIAPIQFKIENNKITLDKTHSLAPNEDKINIDSAREKLISNGSDIISKLKQSNCDKRLIENLEALQKSIIAEDNVIKIGINNISFGIMSAAFKGELSDAINADLQSHNVGVNMYTAQFPDWLRFSENALRTDIDAADIKSVKDSNSSIIKYLEKNPHIADPEVTSAFRQLGSLLDNPTQVGKKTAFAALRTAENLFSKIFHFSVKFFEETLKETAKEIQKTTSKAIAVTIVGLAITGATHLSGVAANIKELSWIKNAIEIVEKQLKNHTIK